MTPVQRARLEQSLVSLLEELARTPPAKVEPNRASEGEVSDEDAQPLNEMLQSIASNRNRERQGVAARVQRALVKLREHPEDFGLCEQCEEEISLARLSALPYAELCLECQGNRDGPKGPATRRRLTDFR